MFQYTRTRFINNANEVKLEVRPQDGSKYVHIIGGEAIFDANVYNSAWKSQPIDAACDKLEIAMPAIENGKIVRLAIYLADEGDCNPLYANALVFKGRPCFIEFKSTGNAAKDAAALVKSAKLYLANGFAGAAFDVTASGSTVTFNAGNEYIRMRYFALELLNEGEGKFEVEYDKESTDVFTWTEGHEGFGCFNDLAKNVILPTGANREFFSVYGEEKPYPGARYCQYVINMCTYRGVLGMDAVGQDTNSLTTHVFWVREDLAADFEEKFNEIGEGGEFFTDAPSAFPMIPEEVVLTLAPGASKEVKGFNSTPDVEVVKSNEKITATPDKGKVTVNVADDATSGSDAEFKATDSDGSGKDIKVTVE